MNLDISDGKNLVSENFEENMDNLEAVVKKLEKGDESLESMLLLFEKGMKLTKKCNRLLDNAEQKINILMKNEESGEIHEEDFVEE
ncbi:MAG: exodeoxyribonuclease VII small subunit [Clostridiales bacterium]|nr:exodeoxyribonuclease VII small subunit [Clostridiales bacterium]